MILRQYYNILYTDELILLLYEEGSGSIGGSGGVGGCAIDESSYLPTVKEFGWCEPCTTSTLAYQKVKTEDRVYMPRYTANVQEGTYTTKDICEADYDYDWGFFSYEATDNVSCKNSRIADIDDYKDSIGVVGSPRTIPEASVMKKRMGEYMKSGVMPILDLSDDSNWDLKNPDSDKDGFWIFYDESPDEYSQYDFERLVGGMGAAVIIVDNVTETEAPTKVTEIMERASLVRQKCYGCLTAFHVANPSSNQSFKNTVNTVVAGSSGQFVIDMVTFDYSVSDHSAVGAEGAEAVVEDIASYGNAALTAKNKPSMVVGFNVKEDANWDDTNYQDLFETVAVKQDALISSGVLGIVYLPTRTPAGEEGIVVAEDVGTWPMVVSTYGTKTDKFCALQKGLERMSGTIPISAFNRINAVNNVSCVECTWFEKLNGGVCDPLSYPPVSSGPSCSIPFGCDPYYNELWNAVITDTGCPVVCLGTETSASCAHPMDYPASCAEVTCGTSGCSIPVGCGSMVDCTISEAEAAASAQRPWHACDDGTLCDMPSVGDPDGFKCPDNTVTKDCPICNETSGTYQCTYTYANGSTKTTPAQHIQNIDSDLYMDYMAGFPKPYKCCLVNDLSGTKYSYIKQTYNTPINKPLVFPKAGGNADCGIGISPDELGETSTFCDARPPPISAFDIDCTIS
jgi:hypothetical protein